MCMQAGETTLAPCLKNMITHLSIAEGESDLCNLFIGSFQAPGSGNAPLPPTQEITHNCITGLGIMAPHTEAPVYTASSATLVFLLMLPLLTISLKTLPCDHYTNQICYCMLPLYVYNGRPAYCSEYHGKTFVCGRFKSQMSIPT